MCCNVDHCSHRQWCAMNDLILSTSLRQTLSWAARMEKERASMENVSLRLRTDKSVCPCPSGTEDKHQITECRSSLSPWYERQNNEKYWRGKETESKLFCVPNSRWLLLPGSSLMPLTNVLSVHACQCRKTRLRETHRA